MLLLSICVPGLCVGEYMVSTTALNSLSEANSQVSISKNKKLFYRLLVFIALVIIGGGIAVSAPHLFTSSNQVGLYVNLQWAHDQNLISQLTVTGVMLWLMGSSLYWGGWLFRRSVRKLNGGNWRVFDVKTERNKFFPHVTAYLRVSCFYLAMLFVFIAAQYPLQYMIFVP